MTRFTMTNDVTWGSGDNPRSVSIMTENQGGFDAYAAKAKDAMADAVKLLENAYKAVSAKKPDSDVARYANRYFLTGTKLDAADALTIAAGLQKTLNGLNCKHGAMALKIQPTHPTAHGSVKSKRSEGAAKPSTKAYHNANTDVSDGKEWRKGAIHITGNRLSQGRLGVKTLIHEATHKYVGTDDYTYFSDDGSEPRQSYKDKFKLKDRALKNADSFAWFAMKVGRGNLVKARFGFNSDMLG